MAPLLKKLGSKSNELNAVQNFVSQAYDPLLKRAWVGDSFLIQDVDLTQGSVNYVPHLLNRYVRGWEIVRRKARAGGYDELLHLSRSPPFRPSQMDLSSYLAELTLAQLQLLQRLRCPLGTGQHRGLSSR